MHYPVIGAVYRHYKSTGGTHHTYKVVGIAKHSESGDELVIYQPLFDAESTWLGDAGYAARPVNMWFDMVEREGVSLPRFSLVSV